MDPSAGTHDGGGAADISIGHRCGRRIPFVVRALRRVGFAAWHRLPSQGPWEEHIHAVAVSDPDLAGGAQHQVGDYYEGRNGLANGAPDDGPQIPKRTWEDYKRGALPEPGSELPANPKNQTANATPARATEMIITRSSTPPRRSACARHASSGSSRGGTRPPRRRSRGCARG